MELIENLIAVKDVLVNHDDSPGMRVDDLSLPTMHAMSLVALLAIGPAPNMYVVTAGATDKKLRIAFKTKILKRLTRRKST